MITEFSLENFRVFRDKTTFKIKPITILTGPNNSGKSSVNKALLLMKENFRNSKIQYGIDDLPHDVEFFGGHHHLGKFSKIKNHHDKGKPVCLIFDLKPLEIDIPITFEFQIDNEKSERGAFTKISIRSNDLELLNAKADLSAYSGALSGSGHSMDIDLRWLAGTIKYNFANFYTLIDEIVSKQYNAAMENLQKDANFNRSIGEPITCKILNVENIEEHEDDVVSINELDDKKKEDQTNNRSGLNQEISELIINFKRKKNDFFAAEKIVSLINDIQSQKKLDDVDDLKIALSLNGFELNDDDFNLLDKLFIILKQDDIHYNFRLESFFDQLSSINEPFQLDLFSNRNFYFSELATSISYNKSFPETTKRAFNAISYLIKLGYDQKNLGIIWYINFVKYLLKNMMNGLYKEIANISYIPAIKTSVFRGLSMADNNSHLTSVSKSFMEIFQESLHNLNKDSRSPYNSDFIKCLELFGIGDQIQIRVDFEGENLHLYIQNKDNLLHISDCGFGYSQIMSLILTFLTRYYIENELYIVEEPETNLHPKLQSKLADFFNLFYKTNRSHFLIETHSEYFIRKLQYLVAKGECDPDDVVIYYIDDPDPERRTPGAPQVREITLDRNGRMNHDFGPGFFDEADNLAIQLFNINQNSN